MSLRNTISNINDIVSEIRWVKLEIEELSRKQRHDGFRSAKADEYRNDLSWIRKTEEIHLDAIRSELKLTDKLDEVCNNLKKLIGD